MDGQTIVVPTGGCSLSQLSCSSCSASSSSGHGPASWRQPRSLEQPLANSLKNSTSKRYFGGRGCERAGRRRLRKESHKLIFVGSVPCVYGKSHETANRREDPGRGSERRLPGADGRQGFSDFNSDENRERYRGYRDGHASEVGLRRDHSSTGRSLAEEHSWPGPDKRSGKVPQNAAVSRATDGRSVQCIEADGEESVEGKMPDRSTGPWDQTTDLNAVDRRKPITRQPILNIPRSELMKIEELRFSGDLQEGDSGPQVLNLQRALFWLGHLPGLSLTGYFGPETTRALQEFHTAHGLPSSGVWGFHSQQALRKHLQPESYRVDSVEKSGLKGPMKSSRPHLSETWPLAKSISGKVEQGGRYAREAVQLWYSKTLPELIASVSSAPQMASVSGRVGIILLGIVVLSSVGKVWLTLFGRRQGQSVRRRVMSWRNDVSLRESTRKALRAHSGRLHGALKASEHEGYVRKPRNRTLSSTMNQQEDSNNLLDRLVLFDGQVLRGDGPSNAKTLSGMSSGLDVLAQSSADDTSRSAGWNKASHMSQVEQSYRSGPEVDQGKAVYGFDRYVKLEADPPRKYNLLSHNDTTSKLTGREPSRPIRDGSCDSPNPSWSALMGNFFSSIFPDKDRNTSQKPAFRRTVRRGNATVRMKTSERVFSEGNPSLRFNKVERGSIDDSDLSKWHDEDDADIRRRVDNLHRAVEAAEQTRTAAMRALAEERMRSLELEVKISRQKEAAASLEEEVRVLKESHDALLASLRKKYSSSAAARAAAALLYQNWDSSDSNARV